jgi:type II secretory pathway pseudopilin PulG
VIIHIPVARAVRVLLNQRANVRDSAVQAKLRNALTAQQAYCSANGTYVPVTPGSESNGSNDNITDYGFSAPNKTT